MITPGLFRQQFPEFTDPSIYTDAIILFWDGIAANWLDLNRWDTMYPVGEALFVAHHLVISARDGLAVLGGGIPGVVNGTLASKSVGDVSASYDINSVSLDNQGFWGTTSYGQRFLQIARLLGAGGIQLGTPFGPPYYGW